MKRYALFRLPIGPVASGLVMTVLLLGPSPAIGQHGGGGHGGGGGGHSGGGHFAGFVGSHSHSSSHQAASHSSSSARPATESTPSLVAARPLADPETRTEEFAPFSPAPAHTTIGFPPAEPTTTFPAIRLRSAQSVGPLSFSGEGHQIWQDFSPPSTIARTPFSAHQTTSPEMRPHAPHIVRPPAFFAPYPLFPTFGFYGFSPYWGFGWGCGPLYLWWTLGCTGLGYGGYGLGYGYGFGGYYPPAWDDSEPAASDEVSNEPSPSTWQNPPPREDLQGDAARSIPNTLIYLRDGSSYEVTDYWLADNKLHYVTNYGGENSVALAQIDMQRTVDANAAHGVDFTLHSAPPPSLTPPPSADSAPPAPQQQ